MAIFGSKLMGYKEYIDPEIQSEFEAKYNAAQKEMKRIKEERKIENLEAEKGAPGVGETIVNAVKNNDIVKFARGVGAKAAVAMNGGFGPREEGYSALDNLEEKYLPYVDSFLDLKNEKETEFVKWRIDKELKIQEDLMKAGTLGLAANFMSQMVDFETWVPVYGQVKKVKAAKNVFDLFKAAGKTAMKVAAISAVQEGLVSTVDPSRTDEDIAYAVGTGAVLGGVLGGTMKGLRTKKLIKQKAALDQLRKIPVKARKDILANIEKFEVEEIRRVARERGELEELTPEFKHSDGGVGAAENIDATFDENEVYGKAARKHLNLTKKLHPGSRLISSVYNTSRNFIKRMVPTSYITKGNMSGVVNPDNVENMTEAVKGYGNVARKKIKDFYKSYRKMAKKNPNLPKMNSREFKEHLTKAISAEGQGYSKEFYNMAKEVHEESIGAMYELMKDNLLKGVTKKYSKTYIPRYYKKKMILENIDTFKNKILEPNLRHHIYETIDELDSGMGRTVRGYMDDMFEDMRGRNLIDENFDDMFSDNFINIEDFRRAVDEIKSGKFSDDSFLRATKLIQLDKSSDEILNFLKKIAGDEEKVNIIRKHLNDFDIEKREFLNKFSKTGDFDQGLRETIEEITSKLLNETQEGANPFNRNFITKGPLKQRALNFISDEELNGSIHGISFIETDLDTIIKNYSRQISPQIALQQNFGTTKWGEARVKLENRMMTELRRSGIKETDAKYPKYRKRIQEELDVMENLWKLTDGSYYADFDNWYRDLSFATKTFNYAAMSGLMLISNLADLSFITMKAGLFKTLKHIKNQVALRKSFGLSKNLDLTNMNLKKDFTRMSLNSEAMLKSKLLQKGDMFNPNLDESVFKKSMKGFGQFVHEASLMGSFQRFTEGLSARIAMDDILNSSRKLLKGELNKKERAYLAKYGIGKNQARTIVDNFKKYGTESNGIVSFNFDNWEDMTLRDSVLSKVKNYANSHIIKGGKGDVPIFFQHPIGAVISQFRNFMVSADKLLMGHVLQNMDDYKVWLGMANSVMLGGFVSKLKKMAKGEDSDMTMEEFIADGLEMSGIFSLPMEVNNLWERMGGYGLRSAMGIESKLPSYYAGDIALSQLLGPTVSTINNAASLLHSDKNMSSVRAARRLTPLVNIFYLRKLGDEYEKMLAKTMGVKYKKKRRKK